MWSVLLLLLVLLLHLVAATPGPQDKEAREARQGVLEQLMWMQEVLMEKSKKQGEEIYV